ncbi:MAG: class I SAM-dependent methyltransferase [Thermodesulfobacteriota bacterium]|nr:class I SAM-dependent methyltransferase [Thermodesulfobacteriota bacterium]
MNNIALFCESKTRQVEAEKLALELNLALISAPPYPPYLLVLTEQRLELRRTGRHGPGPVFVDFLSDTMNYRLRHAGSRNEAIARAIGLRKKRPAVLDGTAGLGKDAFILASLGCRILLLERSPVIAALLADGLSRAAEDPKFTQIIERMTLICMDCMDFSPLSPDQRPDVVYLDPMYPHRSKSSLVKKEMRFLRAIVGNDPDSGDLLAWGLSLATKRVVVKRPKLADHLGPVPSLIVKSKKNRFDVYLIS